MPHHTGLPVAGYKPQSDQAVDLVNSNKRTEESLLRLLDMLRDNGTCDGRWLAIARSHFEEGFMALNRSIFKPGRIALPGDPTPEDEDDGA